MSYMFLDPESLASPRRSILDDPNELLQTVISERSSGAPRGLDDLLAGAAGTATAAEPCAFSNIDVRSFCSEYRHIKRRVDECQQQLDAAARLRAEHMASMTAALEHLNKLNFELEAMNVITDMINQNTKRFLAELNQDALQQEKAKWLALYECATPVLALIRDDLLAETPRSDDAHHQCPICFTGEITAAFMPCGHTFCAECARKVGANCYVCGTLVKYAARIYL